MYDGHVYHQLFPLGFAWKDKNTALLISTRLEMDSSFQNPTKTKAKLWDNVAHAMKKVSPSLPVTGNMCDQKWRNLMSTYKKILQKSNGTGQEATNWQFFNVLNEALGTRSNIKPSPNLIGSSMMETTQKEDVDPNKQVLPATTHKETIKNKFKRKRDDNTTALVLEQLSTLNKNREESRADNKLRWEERKKLEEDRTKALEMLTKAIERATSQK